MCYKKQSRLLADKRALHNMHTLPIGRKLPLFSLLQQEKTYCGGTVGHLSKRERVGASGRFGSTLGDLQEG